MVEFEDRPKEPRPLFVANDLVDAYNDIARIVNETGLAVVPEGIKPSDDDPEVTVDMPDTGTSNILFGAMNLFLSERAIRVMRLGPQAAQFEAVGIVGDLLARQAQSKNSQMVTVGNGDGAL